MSFTEVGVLSMLHDKHIEVGQIVLVAVFKQSQLGIM